ncbi:hypothetical protein ACE2AJ_15540 [Aquihabitans daechungensis]|uniref:hypothetical protein n=1 Tax=Aquihabitans daechungensis TaxID=1052257 RepID=UPI003BA0A9E5
MTPEPNASTEPLSPFQGGAAAHPARQAWLLEELEQWFAGDLPDGRDRRRIVAQALRSATEDAHQWLDERLSCDQLVRVDLHLANRAGPRHSVFPTLPTPLGLLLICLDQCQVGDEVLLVQEHAKAGRVEARATWPFGMDEAESLTRPARVPVGAHDA